MKKQILFATIAAMALAGGCKKKEENKPAPVTKDPGTGSVGSAKDPGTTTPPPAAPLTGEALGKAFVDGWAAWNAGDKVKFTAQYAPDAVGHQPDMEPTEVKGAAALVTDALNFKAGFPDAKGTPQLVLVNGRMVAAVVHVTGTNSAVMPSPRGDMPATNKKVGMLVFHGVTYNDANQITDQWWVMDGNTFANQLGMSPQPGRPLMEKGAETPTIVVATNSDAEKANLAAATKGNEDFNKHDVAAIMAGMADDAVESDQVAPVDTVGKAEIEKGTKMFVGAFSDGKVSPLVMFAAGDYVFQASTFTGTNDGDMMDMKKTGKAVKMNVVEIVKFEGGKNKQVWRFWDSSTMAKQMGMMDQPADPGAAAGSQAAPAKTH